MSTDIKKVKHLITKVIDSIDDRDQTQEMLDFANRIEASWELAKMGGESEGETISNLVDVKVTLNKLEQVAYMNIQMPAAEKARLMNLITSIRTKMKSFTQQMTDAAGGGAGGDAPSLRRSSIISSMVNVKTKMARKIAAKRM